MKNKETLKEAAENYWRRQPYNEDAFKEGARWQQKNISINIIDVDNISVSIKNGVVTIQKKDRAKPADCMTNHLV